MRRKFFVRSAVLPSVRGFYGPDKTTNEFRSRRVVMFAVAIAFLSTLPVGVRAQTKLAANRETSGSLSVLNKEGQPQATCPLKSTQVKAEISGFLARVSLTQEFQNPFKERIEAVYTFPLPQNAAVDDMTMIVGDRIVKGKILRREEAEAIYEAAKTGGKIASLLNQERPNIFTQSVANILPGEEVKIKISYVETLNYEDGSYEFVFPMVVGPRYIPGEATGSQSTGFAPDTDQVPDGSRITPRPAPDGMRSGHDVSLEVDVDAGVAIQSIGSRSHPIDVEQPELRSAHIKLKNGPAIPNKDFVLRYEVAGKAIQDAALTHRSTNGGFFTLILQPPERVAAEDVSPKELVFVLDTSGSMSGFPIEKAKETMKLALNNLYPADTFNVITFAGDTRILFSAPVPATPENLRKAQMFLTASSGAGGTEMMKAIRASLDPSDSQQHVRIVCFMTDGFVGNDMEIIAEVKKHPNARVFAFGIGSAVNRFLLDKMASEGRGEVEYVALTDDGSAAAQRFHQRVRNPLLTDISIDWNGLPVADVYPARIPDLFGAKPLIVSGRYTSTGGGVIRLRGKSGGQDFVREISLVLPETEPRHNVLSSLWARRRIDELMGMDYAGAQRGSMAPQLREAITNLGLEFRLMTQFTSFVAVEEMIVTDGGKPRRVDVPVEVPEGVSRSAVFAEREVSYFARSGTQSLSYMTPTVGSTAETVMVTSSNRGIDTSQPGGTTKIDRTVIDPGSVARTAKSKKGSGSGGGAGGGIAASPALPEILRVTQEQKSQQWIAKLHASLYAVVERQSKQSPPATDESKFVREGKAQVQVWFSDKSSENLAKLKELGFEIILDPKTAKMVIGRLPIEKLQQLAELSFVRYVAPQKFE
jgi:Ca-activated chloride channel homolog